MSIKVSVVAVFALLLYVRPALAHHSFAMFDQTKVVYMTGKVKQLEWVNPHAWLHLTITTSDGKEAAWSFEGGSVAQLASLGWKPESRLISRGRRFGFGWKLNRDSAIQVDVFLPRRCRN